MGSEQFEKWAAPGVWSAGKADQNAVVLEKLFESNIIDEEGNLKNVQRIYSRVIDISE